MDKITVGHVFINCLNDMIKELTQFKNQILNTAPNEVIYSEHNVEEQAEKIKSIFYKIENSSRYFKFFDIETEEVMMDLEQGVMFTVTKAPENNFDEHTSDRVSKDLDYLEKLKEKIENSIANITLD